jgi:hypothetical protein
MFKGLRKQEVKHETDRYEQGEVEYSTLNDLLQAGWEGAQ